MRRLAAGLGVLAALLVGFWTRFPFLKDGLWRDEALTVYITKAPTIAEMIRRNQLVDYNPPFFNLLVAAWVRSAGFGDAALKGFAVFLGLLALVAVAALAAREFGALASILAVLIASSHPVLYQMGGELRPYSLSLLLTALCLLSARGPAIPPARGRGWVRTAAFAILLTLLMYTHVAGALVVLAFGLWGLIQLLRGGRERGRFFAGASLAAGCAFLFWLPTTWSQFRTGLPYENPEPLISRLARLTSPVRSYLSFQDVRAAGLAMLAIVILAGAVPFVLRPLGRELSRRAAALRRLSGLTVAVLVPLSLFSREPRYQAVPAMLIAVLLAGVLAVVVRAASDKPPLRALVSVGVALLAAAIFCERLPEVHGRWGEMGRVSKSGVRDLCRERTTRGSQLVVVSPDYLANTVRYYCGAQLELHGHVLWEDPESFNLRGWAPRWLAPDAIESTSQHISGLLRDRNAREFELVWDERAIGPPLFLRRRSLDLRLRLASEYEEIDHRFFPGWRESVGWARFLKQDRVKAGALAPSGQLHLTKLPAPR